MTIIYIIMFLGFISISFPMILGYLYPHKICNKELVISIISGVNKNS
jgi:hypothetical protein